MPLVLYYDAVQLLSPRLMTLYGAFSIHSSADSVSTIQSSSSQNLLRCYWCEKYAAGCPVASVRGRLSLLSCKTSLFQRCSRC